VFRIIQLAKPIMPFVAFVASVRADEQRVVQKRLYKVFSSRPVKCGAAAIRAPSGFSSIEYEFHFAPFQAEQRSITAVSKGLEINQTAVDPVWEPISYSHDTSNFNRYVH